MMLSYEDFESTGREVDNIGAAIGENYDELLWDINGMVYVDMLWIEDCKGTDGEGRGRWYTYIGNTEYQSDDIEVCLRPLYDFYVAEQGPYDEPVSMKQ